jgi:predicted small lipoprotein YifL
MPRIIALSFFVFLLGCGQAGDLYLPGDAVSEEDRAEAAETGMVLNEEDDASDGDDEAEAERD